METHDKTRRSQPFVKGPLPLTWIVRAGEIPGKALPVGLALWYRAGCTRTRTVTPSHKLWEKFGVSRYAAYRALLALEKAGLVSVTRRRGKNPIVTIFEPPGE